MRLIAAAAAAFTVMLAVPAGAASLVTAPGGIALGNDIITVQGVVVRGPRGGAVVRGPRGGGAVVAPVRRGGPVVVRRGGGRGAVAAGVAAGVVGGLLMGGALAQPEPDPDVVVVRRRRPVIVEEDEPVYARPRCMSFRSYDPRTRSFIDRNGFERPCP